MSDRTISSEITYTKRLYAVCFPIQEKQISEWCWGSCGAGLVGALNLGPCEAVCCPREDCPHLDKQMESSIGTTDLWGPTAEIVVRKLKEVGG